MTRLLLRGGELIDGAGGPPVRGDVFIEGDRIASVGHPGAPCGTTVIDCTGLTVAPSFIDSHSHSDLQVLQRRTEKLAQGVTTEVVGNCGFSPYPAPPDRAPLHEFANGIFCGEGDWGWNSARDYLDEVARSANIGVLTLVGHGTLRIAQVGTKLGALPESDLEEMEGMLSDALSQGAAGFSTGLMYSPGASAPFDELERLCRVVARHGKVYATHMRDYADSLIEATDEQIALARRTGCRLQISHLQAVGPRNWPRQQAALEMIEKAAAEGLDITFDCYPYTRGSTVLTQVLPQWTLEGGVAGLLRRLSDSAERARIAGETERALAQGWTGVLIAATHSEANRGCVGRSIAEIAAERGCEPTEAVFTLLEEEEGRVNVLEINQSEENLRQNLAHPLSAIISDGFYVKGRPHPRLYGTFPYLLGEISRERKWLTLEEAVRKITDTPARRFRLRERGRLEPGFFADVTVFDATTVNSPATYEDPEVAPSGIQYVFREGKLVAGEAATPGASPRL